MSAYIPSRFLALAICALGCVAAACATPLIWWMLPISLVLAALTGVGLWDLVQEKHAIRRNYPVLAHFRFFFEYIRPEIRQYFIESDTEAMPFSRNQRSIVYQRAKQQLDKRPFGTQNDVYQSGFEWMNHSMSPTRVGSSDFRNLIGATPGGAPKPGRGSSALRPTHASYTSSMNSTHRSTSIPTMARAACWVRPYRP